MLLAGFFFPLHLVSDKYLIAQQPLAWTFYHPASYAVSANTESFTSLFVKGFVWIAILSLIVNIVWTQGLKRYESVRM